MFKNEYKWRPKIFEKKTQGIKTLINEIYWFDYCEKRPNSRKIVEIMMLLFQFLWMGKIYLGYFISE